MNSQRNISIKGINVCNPVEVEKEYLLYTVEYAHKNGFNHIQINGPIHDVVKGNIDGMTLYRKYSPFNGEKDSAYIEKSVDAINAACKKAHEYAIKMYVWHHELELPDGFAKEYPQVCNDYGDIEVSHPLVRDFLENKIMDFFHFYPEADGIVLTLHETKIPLLKLKNQKLSKVERVKYVTQILFETCKALGKELIVRPFASIEEDYEMMARAYEEISTDLPVMDKWTQFDWSLTLPHNAFFNKIQKNPLVVEADIFGEFFGKGRLPLMLKKHLKNKFGYCEEFSPCGYVARIDRAGQHPFGDVNEVNTIMTTAYLNGNDPEKAATDFFKGKYPDAGEEVAQIMEQTEEVLEKTIYLNGYYFNELSLFPSLNHSKNHYYFELMRENCDIEAEEWYIPKNWQASREAIIAEKQCAKEEAQCLFEKLTQLKERIQEEEYDKLLIKFSNLKYVTQIWYELTLSFINYVRYFETRNSEYEAKLMENLEKLLQLKKEGIESLGEKFYCINGDSLNDSEIHDYITEFVNEMKQSFETEKKITDDLLKEDGIIDFIVCGGAMEGHCLKKEVNFSDTLLQDDTMCRITGNKKGMKWSSINAHGWFSYKIALVPDSENIIKVCAYSSSGDLQMGVSIGDKEFTVNEKGSGLTELVFPYKAKQGETAVRIRFDKISANVPCICTIKVTQ